jgi:selenocysteine-specific elongation factor
MPQTREHLAILDLLDVRHGIVVISKMDLLPDAELLAVVEAEIAQALQGTVFEGAPVVTCSAVSGEGLPELLATIEEELARTPSRRDLGRPRLPIDRVFTVAGFGTVVTGTLIDGSLRPGLEVEVVPGGLKARIRGLQTHQHKVEDASPGRRLAVNLTGLSPDDLLRGMVVTTPGWLRPTIAVDVRLRAVRYLPRAIRHNIEVTFHTGASEVAGRLLLLDCDELAPGGQAWAQLRLEGPVAVAPGDAFVVRSPNDTLGGGRVVDAHPRRHRRFHRATLETLDKMERGSPEEVLLVALARLEPCEAGQLARHTELAAAESEAAAAALVADGRAVALSEGALTPSTLLFTADGFARLTTRAREVISSFHRQHPLRPGIAREELRSRLSASGGRPFDALLATWARRGELRESTGVVALPDHELRLSPAQQAAADAFLTALKANPFSPPTERQPEPELLVYLEDEGRIVRVGDGIAFAREAYDEMTARIVEHLRALDTITLGQVRDMFATSRKYAQALLEHLDDQRITRRVGDERVLRKGG